MKHLSKLAKLTLRQRKQPDPLESRPVPRKSGGFALPPWALVALCLFLAAGGTWAVLHFIIWNRLPPALVGKWEVEEGPMKGGTFQFSRSGALQVRSNSPVTDLAVNARVAVEDKTLLTTTHNPQSQVDETRKSIIRELTAISLVVELENGEVLKMVRKR